MHVVQRVPVCVCMSVTHLLLSCPPPFPKDQTRINPLVSVFLYLSYFVHVVRSPLFSLLSHFLCFFYVFVHSCLIVCLFLHFCNCCRSVGPIISLSSSFSHQLPFCPSFSVISSLSYMTLLSLFHSLPSLFLHLSAHH